MSNFASILREPSIAGQGGEDGNRSIGRASFCGLVEHAHRLYGYATCPFDNGSIDERGSLKGNSLSRMAPNLAKSQHALRGLFRSIQSVVLLQK